MSGNPVPRDSTNDATQVFNFKGKYADYMRILGVGKGDEFKKIFFDHYKGFAFCVMYGLIKGRRHKYDAVTDNPNNSEVLGFRWTSAQTSGPYKYDSLRKMVILFNKDERPFTEKIDDALRFDYPTNGIDDPELIKKSKYAQNSALVEEYALGGLELIYDKVSSISTQDEMVQLIMGIRQEFNDLLGIKE